MSLSIYVVDGAAFIAYLWVYEAIKGVYLYLYL